ncbi:MAG: chorismate mutase [Bryobacterales bacterium]|nr:chorismate mutase [Bryobacterales bacterium]
MTLEEAQAQLACHRAEIDRLDLEILELLNARARVVEHIGAIKQEMTMPVYEPKREEAVFDNVIQRNRGPLPAESVRRLFERIIDEMRTLQREMMLKKEPS